MILAFTVYFLCGLSEYSIKSLTVFVVKSGCQTLKILFVHAHAYMSMHVWLYHQTLPFISEKDIFSSAAFAEVTS